MFCFQCTPLSLQSPTEGGCLGVGYNFSAPSVSSRRREAGVEPCRELCACMGSTGRQQGSALWAQLGFWKPLLAQHEKYVDLFLTVRERGWLTPDVALLFLPFFCCFPFYITDTTQVWLKIPYSRSLIAYMILRSVDFNAFFNEVGVGLRMCRLQNAVLFCLPLTCYPRSPSPSGFTCSWIICYMVS